MRRCPAMPALAVALLTGCAAGPQDLVCPAIGWDNSADVDASAFGEDAFVQVCSEHGCSPAPGERADPSDSSAPREGPGRSFHFGFDSPDTVTVRVYDAAGSVVHDAEHEIAWTRSTDPCGGPAHAKTLFVEP